MKFFQNNLVGLFSRYLASILSVVLTTLLLIPFRSFLSIQIVVLIYLLPVMISTGLAGLMSGVLAGFLAFLAFNYYFINPYYTLRVHATQDLITLVIFMIVVVVMSQLIGQARQGLRLARSREWEATRMYELISGLAGAQDAQTIARVLAAQIRETFKVELVEVRIDHKKEDALLAVTLPENTTHPDLPETHMTMATARGVEGELRLWSATGLNTKEEKRLLEAYCSQGALSLERVRLTRTEYRARVLEESDRLKTSLLSSVSHELRSPLAAIKASISGLRAGAVNWDTAARQELLEMVEEETDHLNLLVGNLLDMSRIEAGVMKPNRRWNSIAEIAMGVAVKMRQQLKDHRLEIQLADDLPLVPTDYTMIEQVFTNLLSNSIKYAPLGTRISVIGQVEADSIHVQVINQGPGVPEEHLERIFSKFYRVTEADRITGTGLGLSICKGLIEAHGGRIWAENRPGHFVFHFTLPLTLDGALPVSPKEAMDE